MGTFNRWLCAIIALTTLLWIENAHGYKHHLTISKDNRDQFFIESFGFTTGGKFYMKVENFRLHPETKYTEELQDQIYFFLHLGYVDSSEFLQEVIDYKCKGSENVGNQYHNIDIRDWSDKDKNVFEFVVGSEPLEQGLYDLHFINCRHATHSVSFEMILEQYNIDPDGRKDYLPIGLSSIPKIYIAFSVVYAGLFVVWIFGYMRGAGTVVNKVHYLMSMLVVLKFFSLLFYAIEQHYVKIDGVPGGWAIAYYIFAVLKTGFFFVIVTLIGTGWSFFKPFLSDKDKKIIMIVIPLQILDNIAMVIVGATAPGSFGWFTWKDIFRLVDIICCGAILIPIIWSIKHLREASQIDGKAARNLQKLKLFRQFYLIVVSYIYFTRIIIYLLDATLPYDLVWMGDVFTELATLSFFVVVGYKFRPVQGNPYFNLEEEDAARSEEMRAMEED